MITSSTTHLQQHAQVTLVGLGRKSGGATRDLLPPAEGALPMKHCHVTGW